MELSTVVEFDAAHRLRLHKGKCFNLHGHRWRVEINIMVEDMQGDMVIDFGTIKETLKDEFDHKVLVSKDDEVLLEVCNKACFDYAFLPFETTAENLACYIKGVMQYKLEEEGYGEYKAMAVVTVYETPSNCARV